MKTPENPEKTITEWSFFFILEEKKKKTIKMTEVGDCYNIVSKEGSQDTNMVNRSMQVK